jgi:hypothetical protein
MSNERVSVTSLKVGDRVDGLQCPEVLAYCTPTARYMFDKTSDGPGTVTRAWSRDGETVGILHDSGWSTGYPDKWTCALLPSAPPAPVRKGRVGMRVRNERVSLTITSERGAEHWNALADGDSVARDVVRDEAIGNYWTVLPDAPADARAEAVQLRRDDLRPGDRFSYGAGEPQPFWIVGAYPNIDRSLGDDCEMTASGHWWTHNVYNVIRAAAPVATPEVVRAEPDDALRLARYESSMRCDATKVEREEMLGPDDSPEFVLTEEAFRGAELFSTAVSLRLAARAEAKRLATQQHCQPNWAGGDDVDE